MNPASSESRIRTLLLPLLIAFAAAACGDGPQGIAAPPAFEPEVVTPFYTSLSVGYQSGCALDSIGHAYCWDDLWDTPEENRGVPVRVPGGYRWIDVQDGTDTRCGITDEAELYCWGNVPGHGGRVLPMRIHPEREWASLSVAGNRVCAIDAAARGFCTPLDAWRGQTVALGPVPGNRSWSSLSIGGSHACGVTTAGEGYCWGGNRYGQLGAPAFGVADTLVVAPGTTRWKDLQAGDRMTCGVSEAGVLLCWGYNELGQLGVPPSDDWREWEVREPVALGGGAPIFEAVFLGSIFGGPVYSCARARVDGEPAVACWGGRQAPRSIGYGVPRWLRIESDPHQTCGLAADGRIACWKGWAAGRDMMEGEPPVELPPALVWPNSDFVPGDADGAA